MCIQFYVKGPCKLTGELLIVSVQALLLGFALQQIHRPEAELKAGSHGGCYRAVFQDWTALQQLEAL